MILIGIDKPLSRANRDFSVKAPRILKIQLTIGITNTYMYSYDITCTTVLWFTVQSFYKLNQFSFLFTFCTCCFWHYKSHVDTA